MSTVYFLVLKVTIIFGLTLVGFIFIHKWGKDRHGDLLYGIGVSLLASGIFSIADVARDYLTVQETVVLLPPPLREHQELRDPEFWLEMFNKLPPVFVKRIQPGELTHLIDTSTLYGVQGKPDLSQTGEMYQQIKNDHKEADEKASETGYSIRLEYSEPSGGFPPTPILTVKRRFQHKGSYYIVGSYVPVHLTTVPETKVITLPVLSDQVVFDLYKPDAFVTSIPVNIAEALRRYPPSDTKTTLKQ